MKGIERELRAKVPFAVRRCVKVSVGQVTLRTPSDQADAFEAATKRVAEVLGGIENLPVLPREVEDILSVLPRERHKWLADGRLRSIGTRTVKMRGRSKKVTFHVFDPAHIEEILNSDVTEQWREADALMATENRKRGARKAAVTRAGKAAIATPKKGSRKQAGGEPALKGWAEFEADGLLG